MKKIIPFLFILCSSFFNLQAQTWLWGRQGKGTLKANDDGGCVATDKYGNAYMTSNYKSTVSFGGYTLNNVTNGMYLIKYNSSGAIKWLTQPVEKSSNDENHPLGIATDINGNIYVTGYFDDTITFGSTTLGSPTNPYNNEFFLVKYDSSGKLLWARQSISASVSTQAVGKSVATDASGNVYVAGYFSDTASVGAYKLQTNTNYGACGFLAKYDTFGNVLWVKQSVVTGTSGSCATAVAVDKNRNPIIVGYFVDTAFFGPFKLQSACSIDYFNDASDGFVVKYDANGNELWARQSSIPKGLNWTYPLSLVTDNANNIYMGGEFSDTVYFGTTMLKCKSLYSDEYFLAKYSGAGTLQWAKQTLGVMHTTAFNLSAGGGDIYSTIITDTTQFSFFGGQPISYLAHLYNSEGVTCLAKIDTSGKILCHDEYKSLYFAGTGIATDINGKYVYVSGGLAEDTLMFNKDTLISTTLGAQPYIASWQPCSLAGINEINPQAISVTLYPNPNRGAFTLQLSENSGQLSGKSIVEIYNMLGEKVYSSPFNIQHSKFNINQPAGVYLYRIISESGAEVATGKFVVE